MSSEPRTIPRIDRWVLPGALPTVEAMKSWGHNEHSYHPDLWDLEYVTYRYLKGMSEKALRDRYAAVVHSMGTYLTPGRDVIPIISYQSSWYWFRKEHQTRLEFALRGMPAPSLTPCPLRNIGPVQNLGAVPNGEKVIFRYGKRKHLEEMLVEGKIRFAPAQQYRGEDNNTARRDEELQKHSFMAGQYTTITLPNGQKIRPRGDVRRTVSGAGYHMVCFSCVWDDQLFDAFDADACVAVLAPEEFTNRVEMRGQAAFPGWYFHHNPVQYFDPYQIGRHERIDASMCKDFLFAYQNEYRILWAQLRAAAIDGARFISSGSIRDIAKLYDRSGNELTV
jgi:hypothetical protein